MLERTTVSTRTVHKRDGAFNYSQEWPEGKRYCVCHMETQTVIETYATKDKAEFEAENARQFYAKHGLNVGREIFVFMPGIGYYQEET